MAERDCSVVWIVLLDQNVTVESAHLRDCEDADGTEGTCRNRKNLALCNVGAKLTICRTL